MTISEAMHLTLHAHPDSPPDHPDMALEVWLDRWTDGRAELSYHLHAPTGGIVLPKSTPAKRTDDLWKTTCFELFVDTADGYREYNFAPSAAWAAYAFDGYRSGMRELDLEHPPEITTDDLGDELIVDAVIDLAGEVRFGLSAVIEESSGTRSYWALCHPDGPPDFHAEACFAATLPPIEEA
ncbi:DOMON-like domain-containing protein [Sphingomonas sp. GCM10030256]|uniref:DOMON-like domain-containing protein n=1 Tax=Sphingomonas sp. GCM10030256 TaxID=3273427 RepID=UPI00360A160F